MLPTALLKLAVRLPRPPLASLVASHDPLGIKPEPVLLRRHRLGLGPLLLIVGCLGRAPLARLTEELGPPLPRAQLLRQLIPALIAIQLILGLIDSPRLRQDLPSDLPKSRSIATRVPAIFVPSIATSPADQPSLSHSPAPDRTARQCRSADTNRAIVA